ncbi:Coiled-coil domain-containing protein 83 [Merluccius polli]|uniref:Coiled-coil domain-containing protein 83 n=1 Tax=Merluccius polli TaxID=89951 RepID=A0AA47LZ10_MERPO|nr:Coiled-coil domain-containing protein 83 [Merluccius polli]
MDTSSRSTEQQPAESYVEFRVQLRRKEVQDLLGEMDQLGTKKLRSVQLLAQLRSEQDHQMRQLLKQVKEQEKQLERKEQERVKQAEQAKDAILAKKMEMEDVRRKLRDVERKVWERRAECQKLREYRDAGVRQHQAQITQLEEERDRMQRDAAAAAERMRSRLALTYSVIDAGTARAIRDNRLAQEMKTKELNMDESYREALKENEWLKEQVSAYREEVAALERSVRRAEEENVAHCDWLFDQRLKHLSISRRDGPAGPRWRPGPHLQGPVASPTPGCLEADGPDRSCTGPAPPDQLRPRLHNLSAGELQQRFLTVVGQAVPLHPPPSGVDQWGDGVTPSSREEGPPHPPPPADTHELKKHSFINDSFTH